MAEADARERPSDNLDSGRDSVDAVRGREEARRGPARRLGRVCYFEKDSSRSLSADETSKRTASIIYYFEKDRLDTG